MLWCCLRRNAAIPTPKTLSAAPTTLSMPRSASTSHTSTISKPFHSASFSCSVVSTTFVQNVVSFLGAPLIAHLSGKEAEAMPLNWVFEEFCWHWISKRRSPSWIHTYFAKEAACLTQQWMFTNWIKWMQTFILVVVLLILLSTLDRNDVAKHTSWISLSQGHKDTRLLRESARECSSDTWLLYYWLLWHCKLAIQISPMCQQLLSNIGKFPSSIMAVEPVFVALCFQPLDLTKPRHRKESIQASKVWLWRDWLWCEQGVIAGWTLVISADFFQSQEWIESLSDKIEMGTLPFVFGIHHLLLSMSQWSCFLTVQLPIRQFLLDQELSMSVVLFNPHGLLN